MDKKELEKLIDFLDLRITMRKVDKSNLNYEETQLIKLCITCSDLLNENEKYKEVIDRAVEYLETKRIREKAIVDIDVLEGILKEVE